MTHLDFFLNATTCDCQCKENPCPNGLVDENCVCGDCFDNWGKDADGYCTNCLLGVDDCNEAETLDTDQCVCVCSNLVCDLVNDGEVIDLEADCACRPCKAGECCNFLSYSFSFKYQIVAMEKLNLEKSVTQEQ